LVSALYYIYKPPSLKSLIQKLCGQFLLLIASLQSIRWKKVINRFSWSVTFENNCFENPPHPTGQFGLRLFQKLKSFTQGIIDNKRIK
jgi:hypothetical protein